MFTAIKNLLGVGNDGYPKLSTETIMMRLSDCRPPGDKRMMSEYMEMIEIKLETFPIHTCREFLKFNGLQIIFKIMTTMKDDVDIQCFIVSLVKLLQADPEIVTFLVQMGIIEHLNEMKVLHASSLFLKALIPELIDTTLEVGIRQAAIEIQQEKTYLQLCKHCFEVVHRSKNSAFTFHAHNDPHSQTQNQSQFQSLGGHHRRDPEPFRIADVPKDYERINKVVYYMKSYSHSERIQIAGLDAIIVFARTARETVLETLAIEQSELALIKYSKNEKIVWRAVIALFCMCLLNQECALTSMALGAHTAAANMFSKIDNTRIRQQILWLFDSLLAWPRSRLKLQHSADSMRLLCSLDLKNQLGEHSAVSNSQKIRNPGVFTTLVIPLRIRSFLRNTKGKLLHIDKKVEEDTRVAFKQSNYVRAKVEEKMQASLYGTVGSKLYVPGVKGLLQRDHDGEEKTETKN